MTEERSAESRAPGEGRAPTKGGMSSRTPPPAPASDDAASTQEEEQIQKDITDLLSDVERERDEYLDLARRTKADFENYRKRIAGEARDSERRGRAALVRELLPVLDNLERALEASDEQKGAL